MSKYNLEKEKSTMVQATVERSGYYTFEEVAEKLGFSLQHIYRAASLGAFHPVRLGKGAQKHIPKSEVDARVGQPLPSRKRLKQTAIRDLPPGEAQPNTLLADMDKLVPIIANGYRQAVTEPAANSFAHTLDTVIAALLGKSNPSLNPTVLQQLKYVSQDAFNHGLQTMVEQGFSKESVEQAVHENVPIDDDLKEKTASLMNDLIERGEQKSIE